MDFQQLKALANLRRLKLWANKYLLAVVVMKLTTIIATVVATLAINATPATPATPATLAAIHSAEAGYGGFLSLPSSSLSLTVLVAGANKSLQSNNIIASKKICMNYL